jgi:hypothetical protein
LSDLRIPVGFEEALRPPVDVRRARLTPAVLGKPSSAPSGGARGQLMRVVRGAPEVMVKITGRTRDGGHLGRHLDYISRNGALVLEGEDGERLAGRDAVRALAEDWAAELAMEPGRRKDSPVSLSVVLSMPAGTEPHRLHDAARAFAAATFGGRFPYVFALHDEGRHPHVHLTVRMLGRDGERLNPRKADLQAWRQEFARTLRDRGVEAEATPRRARGVVRKADPIAIRKLRDRFTAGQADMPRVLASAWREAVEGSGVPPPWRQAIRSRQLAVRRAFVAEAVALQKSGDPEDRRFGAAIERFVRTLPLAETREDLLRRRIEAARDRTLYEQDSGPPTRGRAR